LLRGLQRRADDRAHRVLRARRQRCQQHRERQREREDDE